MVNPFLNWQNKAAPLALALCAIVANGGCSLPLYGGSQARTDTRQNPFTEPTDAAAAQPTPMSEEEALADVFDELQEMGELDPLAREKLTNDLRSVKAEHWPLMVQQFKSALAYQRQLAQRESEPLEATPTMGQAPSLAALKPATVATPASTLSSPPTQPHVKVTPEQSTVVVSDVQPVVDNSPSQAAPPPVAATKDTAVIPVSYSSAVPPTGSDWRDELESAIAQLEQSVGSYPGNTDEVHDHMRLRMLYLLAGRESDAMLPVPGATPAQQDYWAKQLFALSSFLDNQQQPDDKLRAAGSLMHLDQARSKLAELATLQIRNFSFVESVNGYGVYERRESQEFQPGDPVTLYAEVENFQSDSTKEGYHTTLATSYEVLDSNGQRVDGRQFPDVEDVCQNKRSDFHMQYGVALPTRIYPGEYKLQLTITDQLSHKIGQASVPFVIVE